MTKVEYLDAEGKLLNVGDTVEVVVNNVNARHVDSNEFLQPGDTIKIDRLGPYFGRPALFYQRNPGLATPLEHMIYGHYVRRCTPAQQRTETSCTCSMDTIMIAGCTCGAISRYVEPKL
jgi:hypothetical protein